MFRSWVIVVKLWNADRMINHKSAKEHEMISKICENFSKNKRTINIRDDSFQKIYCLLVIETENNHNLRSDSFKFLKLSAFFLSIKLIEFLVVRFNIFFPILIELIKFLVTRLYALVWTIKSVRYSSVFELTLIKNQIAFGVIKFSIFTAILAWYRIVFDNKMIY